MGFVNFFTDNPLGFDMPEGGILFSISVNPCVKDRTEYLVTYWIEPKEKTDVDAPENPEEKN